MRAVFLALPLASLIFTAGCSCGVKQDCNVCTPAAVVAAPVSVSTQAVAAEVKAEDVLTMEQYQKLLAEGKVTPLEAAKPAAAVEKKAAPTVVKQAVQAEKKAVVSSPAPGSPMPVSAPVVQPSAPAAPAGVMTIPSMPLPEGWTYMHEEDLSDGRLNTRADEQLYYYSQLRREQQAGG
jgi:hypothetical protein